MHKTVAQPLDWLAIQLARFCVHRGAGRRELPVARLERLLDEPEFFGSFVTAPADFHRDGNAFRFTSPVVSPWKRNNVVHGRFFPATASFPNHPTVILLHGWNQELGYETLFPRLARRLNAAGCNAAMFELPYHRHRKPRERKAVRNFLADRLEHVAMAIHQAIADARALIGWLDENHCRPIGVWGISLGGWLAGLLACVEPRLALAVLMTPVARMDRVVSELEFCEPLRRNLRNSPVRLERLNLVNHQPKIPAENILIVAGEHDLFTPLDTAVELAEAWRGAVLRRVPHGHVSALLSTEAMTETVEWITQRFSGPPKEVDGK